MATYCQNEDLILDNGRLIDDYMDPSRNANEKDGSKNAARRRAYAEINENYLRSRTLVPAFDENGDLTIPLLLYIERDLAIYFIMGDSFSGETANISDWVKAYRDRAIEQLKSLKWNATYSTPVANTQNTGNGTVTIHQLFDEFVYTENWILRALSSSDFSVYGSKSQQLPNADVGERWPEYDWTPTATDYGLKVTSAKRWIEYPFHMTITAGSTAFAADDIFYFTTYSANPERMRHRRVMLA